MNGNGLQLTTYIQEKILLIWDKTGKKYNRGNGLLLFRDNILVSKSTKIEKITYSMK